jgi:phage-related protein
MIEHVANMAKIEYVLMN